jgi:hypothetical protein
VALTRCRECQKQISNQAEICPNCGIRFPARKEWRGTGYEWKSEYTIYGYPLIHIAFGRDAQNRVRVAKGVIAIGQFGIGLMTFAQVGIGILFGFGQCILGLTAIAQCAITPLFGVGQFATGYIAIGQFALGYYALAQFGFAEYLWSTATRDPEALEFFRSLFDEMRKILPFVPRL